MAKKNDGQSPNGEISKGLGDKILEVSRAGQLLRDCKSEIREGKEYYLPAIAGQLRALLTDKSGPPNGPLLTKVAKEIGKNIDVFHLPKISIDGLMPTQFELFGFPMSMKHELENQIPVSVSKLPYVEILKFDNKTYRICDIVEWFANKNGGAHYSSKIPVNFARYLQHTAIMDGTDGMIFAQLADLACEITHDILRGLFSWELYTILGIDKVPESTALLIDAFQKPTGMRMIVAYTPDRNIVLHLRSICGRVFEIQTPPIYSKGNVFPLHFSLKLAENFHSTMKIFVNGEICAHKSFPQPILVHNDWNSYDVIFNRAEDRESGQNFGFGVAPTFISAGTDNEYDLADQSNMSRAALNDPSSGMVILNEGGFIHSPVGTSDLKLNGDFIHSKIAKFGE